MQLDFHPVGGAWLVAVAATLLFALLGLGPQHVKLPLTKSLSLRLLRLLAVVLVLLAMLRPTLKYTETRQIESTLLVLVDTSRSMQVVDSLGGASRWETLRLMLSDASRDFARLAENSQVRFIAFDGNTIPLPGDDIVPKLADSPTGDESAIGAALADVLDSDDRLLGVVLLSDGAQRAVPPRNAVPQVVARQLAAERVPLYTFTFGQPGGSDRADLAIEDLVVSDTLFASAPATVSGQLRSSGYLNQPQRVQLQWENAEGEMDIVAAQQITPVEVQSVIPLSLTHTPRTPGEYKVTLRAVSPDGELVTTNNLASTFVTVREGGIRILYLSGAKRIGGRAAGREQRFVRGTLATSPDMIVTYQLIDYAPSEADLTGDLTADRWDVIVLDDVDTTGLNTASWQALVDSVRKGTGLLVTGGYHSFGPGGYSNNRIESVLPLTFNGLDRQRFGEPIRNDVHLQPPVSLVPTQLGLAHPVLRIAPPSELAGAWQELPPLDGANLFAKSDLKPLAQVLADSGPPSRKPLLIAGQGGNGRVMVFAGDSTWRWQMQGHDNEFQRFWRQMMLWLARKEAREDGRVYIDLSTRSISRGGLLELEVGFDRSEKEQETELSFDVTVTTPNGELIPVDTTGNEPDRQAGSFSSTIQPGDYLVQATVRSGDQEIDSAQARFLVPEEDLELDRPASDPGLMAQLAATTADAGGQSLAPEELGTLIADLADRPIDTTEDVLARVTYWDKWPFFLAFMAVVSTEWWLRKRWGLV